MQSNFETLKIQDNFIKALVALKYIKPTDIQLKAIPKLLENKNDCIVSAATGTGKTLAFSLPLLQLIDPRQSNIQAIILAPTRELAQQIFANISQLIQFSPEIAVASICGGSPIKAQIEKLQNGIHVIVATPGRLLDLISQQAVNVHEVTILVLDEADEMLNAHQDSIEQILNFLPKNRRTWLFSATISGQVKQLVQNYMGKNVLSIYPDNFIDGKPVINHLYAIVDPIEKLEILMYFLNSKEGQRGIIFCKTKAAVNKLAKNLAINKFSSGAIHGSLTQPIRDRIMDQFRAGHINILIATDLAARGIDVPETSFVVNYHLPDTHDTYVHRSGRTARAGAEGLALTILQEDEKVNLEAFGNELGIKFVKYKKPNAQTVDGNNAILWAKKIFKTKPRTEIDIEVKNSVKSIFQHLSKEELIEKMLANHYNQSKKIISEK